MGGFFLLCRKPNEDRSDELRELQKGFADIGFAAPEIVADKHYVLAAYPKFQARAPEIKRHSNGDFLFVCGTCLSNRGVGLAAAKARYEAADEISPPADDVMGHYAIILRKKGETEIILDRRGVYQVFYHLTSGIVCSSFYAICLALRSLTLVRQAAYEYVFNGVVSGDETLFREVMLAPIQARIVVGPGTLKVSGSPPFVASAATSATRCTSINQSIDLLDRFFGPVARVFGDRVGSALSGGYDSRLIVACLRRHGAKPRVYVYGSESDADVRLARAIAVGEGFPVAVINKEARPVVPPVVFAETAQRNFLAADGYDYAGIFHNGAEIKESARRVAGGIIAFNGGGGEIFRNFFYLPDRSYKIREILWTFYSQFDPDVSTARFNIEEYYQNMENKILQILDPEAAWIRRTSIEWLYHNFRCRRWDGRTDSLASRFGYTAMPFLESRITEHASGLPLSWKNHGSYEAELITRIDPRLAAYPSAYGHPFSGPLPLQRRLRDYAAYLRPPWLRRYTFRIKYRARRPPNWQGYLSSAYRDAVLPDGPDIVQRLFQLDQVGHPAQYARILSLEYALRQFGTRVKADF
jgi:asparagine synthase (glutamine-hydrolysing)